jgi:arylformamidase
MSIYKGWSAEDLQHQYFLRGLRPDYETAMIPGWLERSADFRERAGGWPDLAYGPRERNRLDIFPGQGSNAGFLLYIHGGYWQRGDKSVYSILAEPLAKRGFTVAVMNYQMCPDVHMRDIPPQARLAVAWLWRHAEQYGIDRENFNIMGHSAGGHLTAEMLCTDWSREAPDLPPDFIHAGIVLSGIFDFEPILYCCENEGLRMGAEEAREVSTIFRAPACNAPQLVGYGAQEPPDMQRQSQDYAAMVAAAGGDVSCMAISDADHFDVVDVLADETSDLFTRVLSALSK